METPRTYTLGEAAKVAGVAKATIHKALKEGRLSYIEKTGAGYKIDPAELARVYPVRSDGGDVNRPPERRRTSGRTRGEPLAVAVERAEMRARLEAAERMLSDTRDQLDDLRAERDDWKGQAQTLLISKAPEQDNAHTGPQERPGVLRRLVRWVW